MSTTHFRRPPVALRRAKLDNLALVPGSMLPYMEACQASANRLPKGGVLIVLPEENEVQKRTMLLVAKLLAAEGHQVAVIPATQVRSHPQE
jgi:hypothetical protein